MQNTLNQLSPHFQSALGDMLIDHSALNWEFKTTCKQLAEKHPTLAIQQIHYWAARITIFNYGQAVDNFSITGLDTDEPNQITLTIDCNFSS